MTTIDLDEVDLVELEREAHDYARSGRRRFMLALADLSSALVASEPVDIPTWVTENLFMPAEKTTRGGPIVLSPIQAAIARFWQTPGVEQVTFLKPPRIGSSFINAAGLLYYACHEAQDVIFYERSEQTAQEFNNDKLMPVLRSSVSVSGLIRPDSKAGEQDRWTDRMLMNGAGLKLRSVSNNGAFRGIRGRFICADEAGSPEYNSSGKRSEGSKVDLIKRRGQEFSDFVLYIGGTPTSGCNVSAEFEKSDKRHFVMAAPCCGHRQAFVPDVRAAVGMAASYGTGLRYTVDERGVPNDAWYECRGCGGRIEETSKVNMMATGVFEATAIGDRGHIGVYVNSMYSTDPRSTWKHVAQAHIAMVRDAALTQTFFNMWLALPYDPEPPVAVDAARLMENVLDLPDGVDAPKDAVYLVAAMDNQEGRRDDPLNPPRGELTVLAACRNNRWHVVSHHIISHLEYDTAHGEIKRLGIDPFSAEYADAVYDILDREYVTADGRRLRIKKTLVDVGWQTELAYKFCTSPDSKARGIIPIRGDTTERAGKRVGLLPANGALKRSKASGRSYLWIGTRDAKDEVARRLAIPAPAPGSVSFSKNLPDTYFEGLLAQRLVETKPGIKAWVNVGSGTGEPWDCLQYAYAAKELVIMRNKRLREEVDGVDPAEAEAARLARAAIETTSDPAPVAVMATVAPVAVSLPVPEIDEGHPLPARGPTLDAPASDPSVTVTPSGVRIRVVERKSRRPDAEEKQKSSQDRIDRIRARQSRSGVGW